MSADSRKADEEVILGVVGDAGQFCMHALTLIASSPLVDLNSRRVEAAVCAAVVEPTLRTRS